MGPKPFIAVMLFVLSVAGSVVAQAGTQPKVQEARPRGHVGEDAVVNPSTINRHHDLPAAARTDHGRVEEDERPDSGWATARWTTATLQLPGNAAKTISIARPSILLVRASWAGQTDLTLSVVHGNSALAIVKGTQKTDIGRVATTRVKVPSAGNVVIRASGARSPAARINLFIGVIADH